MLRQVRIPLRDGNSLSARIWLPASSGERPVPAVLEYIPHRKADMTAARDDTIHPVFARSGYASVRVDTRGAGDSDGVMDDEYAARELADGLEVLTWIAAQWWCDGGVGIIGTSWGGLNGLQLAALRPPELRAVITVCSTDDRYRDAHYNGGVIIGSELLSEAATMLAHNARPQDPRVVGASWRDNWFDRLNNSPVSSEIWLGHQRRDAYWKHGSVAENFSAIQVPVLAVSGLYDQYRSTLFTLLNNLDIPTQAILGPWAHSYPHQAAPGPAIDFLPEAVRWWDRWMKDADNGVEKQPDLRVYMPTGVRPGLDVNARPGRWVAEPVWPSPSVTEVSYSSAYAVRAGSTRLSSTELIGVAAGSWQKRGDAASQPVDQREDDARSFTVTWPEVDEALEIVGDIAVTLTVSADQPHGILAVRLNDVAPDGSSRLVTHGLFNLTHRDSHEHPLSLIPGQTVSVTVPLLASAHRFEPGHRFRVSVSANYWPLAWPSPSQTSVTLDPASITLTLPTRADTDDTYEQTEFTTPTPSPRSAIRLFPEETTRTVVRDMVAGTQDIIINSETDQHDEVDGLHYYAWAQDRYLITEGIATSAVAECRRVEHYRRSGLPGGAAPLASNTVRTVERLADDWDVKIVTFSRMSGDASSFFLTNQVTAFEGSQEIFSRNWSATIPRDHT
ncbi:CocE/NonD family hydrolase [Klugiella xanthotipulae]|uniref:CocE/NonD family hydrolase n=1 Tax=Klugiella xanthotipulae TaxID=244735 RepID=UPI001B881DE2|nr:CocE/NonD family hydrolase [Klugiella xanthotipulae]